MKLPDQFHYTPEHLWVRRLEDDYLEAGITDYAQDMLGDIVFIQMPGIGSRLNKGEPCGLIESVKTGSDLHAPLSGTVSAVNEKLADAPESINDAPYQAWIFRFKPDSMNDFSQLMDATTYQSLTEDS